MRLVYKISVFAMAFFLVQITYSQTPEEVIKGFFQAFNAGDSKKLQSYFAEQTSMYSVFKDRNDSTIIKYEKVSDFIHAFSNQGENKWKEEIFNINVEQDGDLAQAWLDYKFYLNGKLNHCGVDAFQLAKIKSEWKIVHLADTRRRHCE